MLKPDGNVEGNVDTHYISKQVWGYEKRGYPFLWKSGHPLYKGRVLLKPGRVGAIARSGSTMEFSGKCASARGRD